MLRKKKFHLMLALLIGGALAWTVDWQAPANAGQTIGGQRLAVVIKGTAEGEFRMIDGVEMNCFDADLVDAASGRIIGRATDCLDLDSIEPDPSGGDGFSISNTQFFHLPGGTIKSLHRTTIQPVLEGSPGITHITGAIADDMNILAGTGRFKGVKGTVRLLGAVNLARLGEENIITFDCIFRIDLDR